MWKKLKMTVIISIVVLDCGCSNHRESMWAGCAVSLRPEGEAFLGLPGDQAAPVLPLIGISAAKEFEK